jgi:hypothetical protein
MSRLLLMIALCFGLSGCHSAAAAVAPLRAFAESADEQSERDAIFREVQTAVAARNYTELSAMESEFRLSHSRTSSGIFKLEAFHAGAQFYLAEGIRPETKCEFRDKDFVRQWTIATPRNPAPVITNAALLLAQAWCFRGSGYADTVKTDAWPMFSRGAAAALETLEACKDMASVDPEFYAVTLDTMRALGADEQTFHATVVEATAREPDYHRIYYSAAWHYLPQWGGSFEAVDKLARYAVERSSADERRSLYARIYWSLEECGCQIVAKHTNRSMMKQSMRDIFDLYPTPWNGNYFAELACQMGDIEEGHRYFRAMHPETTDERSFAALFSACDMRAQHPA